MNNTEQPDTGAESRNEIALRNPQFTNVYISPEERKSIVDAMASQIQLVRDAMKAVMVEGTHYGTIKGTRRPSLWQPGAEIITQLFGWRTEFECMSRHEDWDAHVFSYTYKCKVFSRNGDLMAEREATCSTQESQYLNARDERVTAFDQRETITLMAQKRAFVATVRAAGACSALFTQDDDIVPTGGTGSGTGAAKADLTYHCPIHEGATFFKSPKMHSFAHPYEDENGKRVWCDMNRLKDRVQAETLDMVKAVESDPAAALQWMRTLHPGAPAAYTAWTTSDFLTIQAAVAKWAKDTSESLPQTKG